VRGQVKRRANKSAPITKRGKWGKFEGSPNRWATAAAAAFDIELNFTVESNLRCLNVGETIAPSTS